MSELAVAKRKFSFSLNAAITALLTGMLELRVCVEFIND